MMKKILTSLLLCLPVVVFASGGHTEMMKADINLENKQSLRHGAKLFVNYCLSCHSAAYMRYNRLGRDLELSDEQVEKNLMFVGDFSKLEEGEAKKIGELMTVAMQKKDAQKWFGTAVPDLTVVARARGADWIYTYLNSFYLDDKRPFGVNNTLFGNVSMPHVLWEMDGFKKLEPKKDDKGNVMKDSHDKEIMEVVRVSEGSISEAEYKRNVNDLVNFLVYMGEPIKMERQRTGIFVMFFLVIFFIFAYFLKKEYWKDVH